MKVWVFPPWSCYSPPRDVIPHSDSSPSITQRCIYTRKTTHHIDYGPPTPYLSSIVYPVSPQIQRPHNQDSNKLCQTKVHRQTAQIRTQKRDHLRVRTRSLLLATDSSTGPIQCSSTARPIASMQDRVFHIDRRCRFRELGGVFCLERLWGRSCNQGSCLFFHGASRTIDSSRLSCSWRRLVRMRCQASQIQIEE